MAINSTTKSSRILQSRRYTQNQLLDSQEAFTRVLDLNAQEIYTDQVLIPTSSLPFSGSSQNQVTYSVDGKPVLKYWYRLRLSPSATPDTDGGFATWFALSSYNGDGANPQEIQTSQLVNFISPKYSIPDLARAQADVAVSNPVGYGVYISASTGEAIPASTYQFDYKTGVLQFVNNTGYAKSKALYITAYQYVGRTLASDQTDGYSGSFSGSFQGNGDGLTNIPASGIVGLNLTQVATTNTTASVSEGSTAFTLTTSGTPKFTIDNLGGYKALSDSTITGSLEISQNLVVQGTASFARIESVTGSAKIIGDAFIILNSNLPAERYAGILVEDSGSATGQTGSLLYDSEADLWFYDSTTEGYAAGFLVGATSSRDNLIFPEKYSVTRGDGSHHIVDSNIYTVGSNVTINKGATGSLSGLEILGDLEVTGSARFTAGVSGSFSGSFEGDGAGLTNLPASSIVGLNLTQIADSFVSASVSSTGTPFKVSSGGPSLFEVDETGGITTFSTSSLQDIQVTGSAVIQNTLTAEDTLLVLQSTILSGSLQTSGSTTLSGTTQITGSATIISDAQVTGSINVLGSTNTVGTSTVDGEMVITGSLTVSGSSTLTNVGPAEFTGSTGISGTLTVDGISSTVGTALVSGSTILSGSVDIEGPTNIVGLTQISSSITSSTPLASATTVPTTTGNYIMLVSESAWFKNHNIGVPKSNAWKDANLAGSYFENFDHNTNVSEVLRFLAGLLKDDAPSPSPNTRTYNSVSVNDNTLGGTDTINVISGQRLSLGYTSSAQISQSFKDAIDYGIAKGFSAAGTDGNGEGEVPYAIANSSNIYYENFNTYNLRFTSGVSSGTGGNGSTFFGTGKLDPPANLKVRLLGSMSFSDTYSDSTVSSPVFTQANTLDLSKTVTTSTAVDGNGLAHAIIQTANPAVIPNTYQDSKFVDIGRAAFLTRSYGGVVPATSTISSSGWYKFYGLQVGYTSGSDTTYTYKTTTSGTKLWMPVGLIETSMSANPATITGGTFASSSLTLAPSRSYSGVPYLTAGTSTWTYLGTGSGMFDPAYRDGVVFRQSIAENLPGTVTIAGSTNSDVSCDANGVATSGKVYDAAGNVKNSGLPRIDDEVRSNVVITHSISSGNSNIAETGFSTGTTFTGTTTGYAFNADDTGLNTSTFPYHEAGTYGQPAASGSLGIYGGGTSNNVSTEYFTSESYRRVISNSTTLTTQWDETAALTLGDGGDLQVKPSTTNGYLVNPESTKGYWYPKTGYSDNHYKWFMREITTNATANRGSITLDFDPDTSEDFIAFDDTTTGKIALGLVFEAQVAGKGAGNVVMYDVIKGNGSYGGSLNNQAPSTQLNPFSDNIDVQAGFSSISNVTGTITLRLDNNVKQIINGTYKKVWLLVRYRGVPANSLRGLTVTVGQ